MGPFVNLNAADLGCLAGMRYHRRDDFATDPAHAATGTAPDGAHSDAGPAEVTR